MAAGRLPRREHSASAFFDPTGPARHVRSCGLETEAESTVVSSAGQPQPRSGSGSFGGSGSEPDVGPVLCPVVIGRAQEVAALDAALSAGGHGHGETVLLLGEAGVGKSRLAKEVSGLADQRGWVVLNGRAVPSPGPAPFRPIVEALLSALRVTGLPDAPELAPFRAALGRLVPEWRKAGSTDVGDSIVVLAEGVLRLLRSLAGTAGCLLVLEDLHWADPETLAVVEYLADNLPSEPVVCLATIRTEEASAAIPSSAACSRSAPSLRTSSRPPLSSVAASTGPCSRP